MKVLIKTILNILIFLHKKIINKIKFVLNTQRSISLIDVGSHKGEYISSVIKIFKSIKFMVLNQTMKYLMI